MQTSRSPSHPLGESIQWQVVQVAVGLPRHDRQLVETTVFDQVSTAQPLPVQMSERVFHLRSQTLGRANGESFAKP
jgi:hypothetical protein